MTAVVGLALTALGVIIAFYLPRLGSYWGVDEKKERRLQIRFAAGVGLVVVGTLLQIYAAWPT